LIGNSCLFDACSILTIIRQLRGDAAEKLVQGSTTSLAYYEIGNALWRECFLLKRISQEETEKLLKTIYPILAEMDTSQVEDEAEASAVLVLACKFNLTFYDASYLSEAVRAKKTLVTEDKKLAKATKDAGAETLTSNVFIQHFL